MNSYCFKAFSSSRDMCNKRHKRDLRTIRALFRAMIALLLLTAGSSCRRDAPYRQEAGVVWSTTYHITYRAEKPLTDSIMAAMKRVERSLSPFMRTSLISRVNAGESGSVRADTLLARVMLRAHRVNALSGGMFDPTVGPLVEVWGFGTDKRVKDAPSDSLILSLLPRVGMDRCGLDAEGRVVKKHPLTMFNFSAITKGLGCDEVARALRSCGVEDYMVEIGGEIALGGVSPRGGKWVIAIDRPAQEADTAVRLYQGKIAVSGCGVATSGNYRNRRATARGTVGHTISPVTGMPVQTDVLSATVVAPDCMTADALATACMAMGSSAAMAMVGELEGVEAMLILPGDSVAATPGFPWQ